MRGLESRYSAGLSMLRILSTRSPGRRRISSSGIIGFHGLHEGLAKETRPSPPPPNQHVAEHRRGFPKDGVRHQRYSPAGTQT